VKHLPYLLLAAASSLFLLPTPADASKLESWRFDANQSQLEFSTDQDVQPTAQLLSDPTRLVIDLPGIVLGRPALTQLVGGTIQNIRVGQFDRGTTRIVVEMAPGYTIDPSQVKFRGITARQWTVKIPTPVRDGTATTPRPLPGSPTPTLPRAASTQLQSVQVTQDGIFVRTGGGTPEIRQSRSADRQQITVDLLNTTLALSARRDQLVGRLGISRLQLSQVQASPPIARVTLNVDRNSPDWQASVSSLGGVAVIPLSGGVATQPTPSQPPTQPTGQLATIEAIELDSRSNQLVIRANQPLSYTSGWDRTTASYRITINSAQLDRQVKGPAFNAQSPIRTLRLRQEDARTVVILVQPATGVQITEPNQLNSRTLALQLQRPRPVTPPTATIPVPVPPRPNPTGPTRPRIPNGKLVVVVDPGHGGPDPGAIGIRGIQEKEIVLDISRQVASLLEQQGIQAVLTREDDRDLDLEPRVQLAKQVNAALFVSIHANAIDLSRPDINGLETYYYDTGLALAQTIHASILQATGMPDRRVRQARFYVLRKTSMPSVLVETGFVTGRDDAARLSSPAFRTQMATAIVRGIVQYIQRSR
jgi:N-acetylmuramoyl-L-alanine amidase